MLVIICVLAMILQFLRRMQLGFLYMAVWFYKGASEIILSILEGNIKSPNALLVVFWTNVI